MPTPNDARRAHETAVAIQQQTAAVNERLDRLGIVSPARRRNARAKGYRGVLTRHELARQVNAN